MFFPLALHSSACASGPFAHSEQTIVSLSTLSPFVLGVSGLILVAGLLLHTRSTSGAKPSIRIGLFVLRFLFSVGVFLLLLEPGLKEMEKVKIPNRILIALDTSESMAQALPDGDPRIRAAVQALPTIRERLEEAAQPLTYEMVAFHKQIQPLTQASAEKLAAGITKPVGQSTHLQSIVDYAATLVSKKENLSGIVVITDGADTERSRDSLSEQLSQKLKDLGVPMHFVQVGSEKAITDLAITNVLHDDFAFVRNKLKVEATIQHQQVSPQSIDCTLRKDGKPIASKTIAIKTKNGEQQIEFEFEPDSAGDHIYSLSVPILGGESIVENNRIDFTQKVIRDRIRVLQVAGQPSWDERFVRRLLKENPSVDLISFFILRSNSDRLGAPRQALSLIPFPTRELFTEELDSFDIVIFQNFNYRPYQMGVYLKNIRDFVEKTGGGFMMIGGALSFSEGDYDGTPIANILPVTLLNGAGHMSEDLFHPILTEAGKTHPITQLSELGASHSFDALPQLEGINLVAGLAPNAKSLLSHPYLNIDGEAHPVIATREVGNGRSVAVLTDSLWNWSLPHLGTGGQGDVHRRLLANAIRWLIRDPALSRVQLKTNQSTFEPGEAVGLEIRTFDPQYGPAANADVSIVYKSLDISPTGSSPEEVTIHKKTNSNGFAQIEFTPENPGAWRISAIGKKDGERLGSADISIVINRAKKETLHAQADPRLPRAMAAQTGGQFFDYDDIGELSFVDHKQEKILSQKSMIIWDKAIILCLLVLLGSAEWWWRRRKGFA